MSRTALRITGLLAAIVMAAQTATASDAIRGGELRRPLWEYYHTRDTAQIDRVWEAINRWGLGWHGPLRPTLTGFMAVIFRQNPDAVSRWTNQEFRLPGQMAIARALVMSGRQNNAETFARRYSWNASQTAILQDWPTEFAAISTTDVNFVDLHMGAFWASGDTTHLGAVVDLLSAILAESDIELLDLTVGGEPPISRYGAPSLHRATVDGKYRDRGDKKYGAFLQGEKAIWRLGGAYGRSEATRSYLVTRARSAPSDAVRQILRWLEFKRTNRNKLGVRFRNQWVSVGTARDEKLHFAKQRVTFQTASSFADADVFAQSEPVKIYVGIGDTRDCPGAYQVAVRNPEGVEFDVGRGALGNAATRSRVTHTVELMPSRKNRPGVYEVTIRIDSCEGKAVTMTHRFFVLPDA